MDVKTIGWRKAGAVREAKYQKYQTNPILRPTERK